MTKRTRWPRLTDGGPLCCQDCDGNGYTESADGHPDDPYAASIRETCERCGGSGAEPCACGCGSPATVDASDARSPRGRGYATVEHAWRDGAWPACERCRTAPQSETHAPWCSAYCVEQTAADVARVAARLPRAA